MKGSGEAEICIENRGAVDTPIVSLLETPGEESNSDDWPVTLD